MTSVLQTFSLCCLKWQKFWKKLDNILQADWAKKLTVKKFCEAVNRQEKQGEESKRCFFYELTKNTQSNTNRSCNYFKQEYSKDISDVTCCY